MLTSSLKRHANHIFVVFDGKVNTFLAGTNKILRLFALLTFSFNPPAVPFLKLTAFCICCYSGY